MILIRTVTNEVTVNMSEFDMSIIFSLCRASNAVRKKIVL